MKWFRRSSKPDAAGPTFDFEPRIEGQSIRLWVQNTGLLTDFTARLIGLEGSTEHFAPGASWPIPWESTAGNYQHIDTGEWAALNFAECQVSLSDAGFASLAEVRLSWSAAPGWIVVWGAP